MPDQETTVSRFLKSEISFYGTVIVAIFSIASMYFGLANRIDLLSQALSFSTSSFDSISAKEAALEVRLTVVEKDHALMQAQLNKTVK